MGNSLDSPEEKNKLKVFQKLKAAKTQEHKTDQELLKIAETLINPRFLKEHFKKNIPKYVKFFQRKDFEEDSFYKNSENEDFENEQNSKDEFVWIEDYFDHFETQSKGFEGIKVKLVLSNIAVNSIQKMAQGYLAPLLSAWDLLPEFGFLHSSLIFGPWKLEWTNNELIVPKETRSSDCVICLDLYSITTKEELDRLLDIVINVIIDWNINISYKQNGDPVLYKNGNCQQFVDTLIQKMDLQHRIEKLPLIISRYCLF